MKKTIISAVALVAAVSCQESIITDKTDGLISVSVTNSPVVEVLTKAGEEQYPTDDFNVYVISGETVYDYIYKDMPSPLQVPAGMYKVAAENVSVEESFAANSNWGQVRYSGESEINEVKAGGAIVEFRLTCSMANTALSVDFDEGIDVFFDDYSVTVYTDEARKLVYGESTDNVAYFNPETLYFVFTGKFIGEEDAISISGTKELQKATHLHLTFDITEQNGSIGRPEISVVTDCEDLYRTITVDPSDGTFTETESSPADGSDQN